MHAEREIVTASRTASHLDLFGEGSLFELLCAAQTAAGQEAQPSPGWQRPSPQTRAQIPQSFQHVLQSSPISAWHMPSMHQQVQQSRPFPLMQQHL